MTQVGSAPPRISICLPTYNRSAFLRQSLGSVLEAASRSALDIEIVVSDNASLDDTEAVVRSFAARGLSVRYFRNPKNVGGNRNLVAASAHATGDYIWLFGDDDLFLPDALVIVEAALRDAPDAVVLDFEVRDRKCERTLIPSFFRISESRLFTDRNELLRQVNGKLGLLSCMLMKRDLWQEVPPAEHEIYIQTGLNHVYAFYAMLPEHPRVRLQSGPVFIQRGDNSGGYDWVPYFVDGFATIYRDLGRMGYSWNSVNAAKSANCINVIAPKIALSKADGARTHKILARIFRYYWYLPAFWFVVFPVCLLPRRAILLARRVRKKIASLSSVRRAERLVYCQDD